MTITLGEALTAQNDNAFDLQDPSITEGLDKAKDELDKGPKKFNRKKYDRGALNGALRKALFTALDVALDDILGQAWSGWKDLRKYADPEQTPPDDVNVVPLSNHTVESLHEPSVDVVVHGVTVHRFPFHVSAKLDVQGVNLVVQRGMIQEIQLGSLKLGGSIKLRDYTLLERKMEDITIPGVMHLETPIPIA